MCDLNNASINVRGIGNDNKKRETFNWLRPKQQSVYFLQEKHCTEKHVDKWRAEWGYKALLAVAQAGQRVFASSSTITLLLIF